MASCPLRQCCGLHTWRSSAETGNIAQNTAVELPAAER
jgi:hypothetical protein